jgi:hypothetical protein
VLDPPRTIEGYGNNADPVSEGRCCDRCNGEIVIPARVRQTLDEMTAREAVTRPAIERILLARLKGIEPLRELLLTDEEVRDAIMCPLGGPLEPSEDLEVAVNDFIKGMRQETNKQRREHGYSVEELAADKEIMAVIGVKPVRRDN